MSIDEPLYSAKQASREAADSSWVEGLARFGLVGLAFIAAALLNAYRAFTQRFEENWNVGEMSPVERQWLPRVSSIVLLARFVVFGLLCYALFCLAESRHRRI